MRKYLKILVTAFILIMPIIVVALIGFIQEESIEGVRDKLETSSFIYSLDSIEDATPGLLVDSDMHFLKSVKDQLEEVKELNRPIQQRAEQKVFACCNEEKSDSESVL